ncbi:GDSL esterase/lipase At5g03980 [Ricinus communis]|uniref:GDSL esterase/lipase At5g03980 n=1 Tax=Ricinus communis TaxID=3988 RepID=UPI00201AE14A|nr:GDSL esterase/lipase At5g03980 [Ricinus communis]
MANCKLLSFLLLCSVFLLLVVPHASTANLLQACNFDAIYQLGDSISDTGNLVQEDPSSFCGRLPYGQNFFNNKPTGRCSNGLLMIDYIALSAGVPLLNPYLINPNASDHNRGVNFAVAGSTALPADVLARKRVLAPVTNSSLTIQLNWMSAHFNTTCDRDKCQHNKSLFMVGEIGGNDYNYALFQGKTVGEVKSMVPEVVQAIKTAVNKVIGYGATRVVVPGNFPIGCLPIYLTGFNTNDSAAYDELHCLKGLNSLSVYHNEKLQQAIEELQQEHQNAAVLLYGDYYNAYKWVLLKAAWLGFDLQSLQKACCGSGGDYDFSFGRMCGVAGVAVCPKPQERISWDGIHPTEKAYLYMARLLIRDMSQKFQCCAQIVSSMI